MIDAAQAWFAVPVAFTACLLDTLSIDAVVTVGTVPVVPTGRGRLTSEVQTDHAIGAFPVLPAFGPKFAPTLDAVVAGGAVVIRIAIRLVHANAVVASVLRRAVPIVDTFGLHHAQPINTRMPNQAFPVVLTFADDDTLSIDAFGALRATHLATGVVDAHHALAKVVLRAIRIGHANAQALALHAPLPGRTVGVAVAGLQHASAQHADLARAAVGVTVTGIPHTVTVLTVPAIGAVDALARIVENALSVLAFVIRPRTIRVGLAFGREHATARQTQVTRRAV